MRENHQTGTNDFQLFLRELGIPDIRNNRVHEVVSIGTLLQCEIIVSLRFASHPHSRNTEVHLTSCRFLTNPLR